MVVVVVAEIKEEGGGAIANVRGMGSAHNDGFECDTCRTGGCHIRNEEAEDALLGKTSMDGSSRAATVDDRDRDRDDDCT